MFSSLVGTLLAPRERCTQHFFCLHAPSTMLDRLTSLGRNLNVAEPTSTCDSTMLPRGRRARALFTALTHAPQDIPSISSSKPSIPPLASPGSQSRGCSSFDLDTAMIRGQQPAGRAGAWLCRTRAVPYARGRENDCPAPCRGFSMEPFAFRKSWGTPARCGCLWTARGVASGLFDVLFSLFCALCLSPCHRLGISSAGSSQRPVTVRRTLSTSSARLSAPSRGAATR